MDAPAITPPPAWLNLLSTLENRGGGTTYILGATDRGKTTLCTYLIESLTTTRSAAYIDCDTGQSTIGPPTTIGLALFNHGRHAPPEVFLRFVGSTTPQGHFLPFLTGAKRLLEKAGDLGANVTLVDSPGYIEYGAAQEFQIRMIDLLQPDILVAIQRERELEPILAPFRHHPVMRILRFLIAPEVRVRSQVERRENREQKFRAYFSGARHHVLSFEGIGVHGKVPDSFHDDVWRHLLIALCDWDQLVLTLALVEHLDLKESTMTIFSPPFARDRLASIQVGSFQLDLSAT